MGKIFFCRHGKRSWGHKDVPIDHPLRYDSPLSKEGIRDILKKRDKMLDIFEPDEIICSPYMRTRHTAFLLHDALRKRTERIIPISIFYGLSEFLGDQTPYGEIPELDKDTIFRKEKERYLQVFGFESRENFKQRCYEVLCSLINIDRETSLLVVTHGFVISTMFEFLTGEKLNKVDECSGFIWDTESNIICHI